MSATLSYTIQAHSSEVILSNLLQLTNEYVYAAVLHSNLSAEKHQVIAAFGNTSNTCSYTEVSLKEKWYFGYLAYDLKNQLEDLESLHSDFFNLADSLFFEPEFVVRIEKGTLLIDCINEKSVDAQTIIDRLTNTNTTTASPVKTAVQLRQRVSKQAYISAVEKIKQHIRRGDIYELNYCMEFYAEKAEIDPLHLYQQLNTISEAPYSCLVRLNGVWMIGSSPERFLKKENNKLLTQPIKGTAKRSSNQEEDHQIKKDLLSSLKERTENVMIVDVARNDLSRIAEKGTVNVDELYGIYTYKQVHQMISTVSCQLRPQLTFKEIVQATFPMASMTGAPKISAMKLIAESEVSRRGLYSGSFGYISPEGNFDFNVIIRSILYNTSNQYLSFSVGSAITHLCDPEQEYGECLLKAKAMMEVLGSSIPISESLSEMLKQIRGTKLNVE